MTIGKWNCIEIIYPTDEFNYKVLIKLAFLQCNSFFEFQEH